ncbi:DNA polymerase subunit Cdc27-domain-containing protein [Mycena leptocephala]|nr:DNA polymerase subunit Cdc27-domain-containing protein [Mycena leptocephala]
MSTQPIRDYLTKQLLIEKNIVTYRSLSRACSLNVNVAKNELADFHASDGQNLAATYLLSGQTQPVRKRYDEDIDMDDGNPYEDEEDEGGDEEYVPQTEIVLVGERGLESAQAQFITLDTIHVYSLSPSVIRASFGLLDAGLLCTPTEVVRTLDSKKGSELATVVGKIISAHVTVSNKPLPSWGGRKAPAPVAGSSKITAAATSAVKKDEDAKPKEKEKEKEKAKPEKSKPTGKLDFSKAKTKPLKKEEEKPSKKEEKPVKAEAKRKAESRPPSVASSISEKVQVKMDESKKRGTKRKSALASDSEEEEKLVVKPAKPVAQAQSSVRIQKGVILSDDEEKVVVKPAKPVAQAQSSVRIRKGVILSDDEEKVVKPAKPVAQAQSSARIRKGVILSDDEEDEPQPSRKGKGKASASRPDSQSEKDLRAMMDIDDDAVTRASRDAEPEPESEDDAMEVVDTHMSDGDSKPAPVKRKPKKVVPVGKNGLKKKRIVKSKMRIDEKGYMVTEDYSEYESVDEEEPAPPPKAKAKPKAKSTADDPPAKVKPAPKPAPAKAKPKPSGGTGKAGQQAGIAGFFGKSKSK